MVKENLDAEQIIQEVYDDTTDPSNPQLKTSVQGVASSSGTDLDWRQVIQKCWDPTTGTLKVVTV